MHHFISYSTADGHQFALKLADALEAGPPSFPTWLDERRLQPVGNWATQIDRAIRTCESLIFVMTPDSVEDASVCMHEWVQALKYKKPLVLVRAHGDAELPFLLNTRHFIDFSADFESGLTRLRQYLGRLNTDEVRLHMLNERLADAKRDLRRAGEHDRPRIEREMQELQDQIARLEAVVRDPAAAAARVQQSIATRIEAVRQPPEPVDGRTRTKFINPPPMIAPAYFQDRVVETKLIADFLRDDALRLMTITGRGGVGKTAMVCRLLRALESGRLPDDLGPLAVDGIVYLSHVGSHTVCVANLYADLCRLLPEEQAGRLDALYRDAKTPTRDKLLALLERFQRQPVVVLLDNLEKLQDASTRTLTDDELDEALRAVLEAPHHTVKVLITTRVPPSDLPLVQPQRQRSLALDEGLQSPYAENILRELDADGLIGLKTAHDQVLSNICVRTRGFPRALEAFYGALSADRSTTLEELLSRAAHALPETVVEPLVGEAFSRLDRTAQLVMQALAVYARPVPPVALDYLLQPHVPAVDATPVLNRLVNMHFVRKEQGRYYLHPIDQAYALGQLPDGAASEEREPGEPLTRMGLRHRGAEFFRQTRRPRSDWKRLSNLEPQLAEFDLLCAAQEYDAAADVLDEIDFDYLLLWGHARLILSLRERLRGRLTDKRSAGVNLTNLGNAYWHLGQVAKAAEYYEQALAIAREIGDRRGEGVDLGNLGLAYSDLGQVTKANKYYEQALAISREIGDRRNEGVWLGLLGNAHSALGQVARAIAYYEQALAIACEIGNRRGEGKQLGNLGNAYRALGQVAKANEYYEQALAINREVAYRRAEGANLGNLGLAYCALGQVARAIAYYEQALAIACEIGNRSLESREHSHIGWARLRQQKAVSAIDEFQAAGRIADETGFAECQAEAQMGLAMAFLLGGRFEQAASAVQAAREADYVRYLPTILALQGTVAVRRGDRPGARVLFADSIRRSDELLAQTPELYEMLQAKGLALCGLALCDGPQHVPAAIEAYRAARTITSAAGIVQDALMLFDALAADDTANLLAPVRPTVG